jgi:hypothetical protein
MAKTDISKSKDPIYPPLPKPDPAVCPTCGTCPTCGAKKQEAAAPVQYVPYYVPYSTPPYVAPWVTPFPYTVTYENGYISPLTTTRAADQGQSVVSFTYLARGNQDATFTA